jgi:hypothetical protein
MRWFGLDPDSVVARVKSTGNRTRFPSLTQSVLVGSLGFGVVSLAAFGVWAGGGDWLQRHAGERGLYAVCAAVLIGGGGGVFGHLVIGPDRLRRFYGLFALAFFLYAGVWTGSYFSLRSRSGEWLGSLLGPAILGMSLANAFGAPNAAGRVIGALLLTHAAGYFAGGFLHDKIAGPLGMLLWGVSYGLGFGAGIGYTLYICQYKTRGRLQITGGSTSSGDSLP